MVSPNNNIFVKCPKLFILHLHKFQFMHKLSACYYISIVFWNCSDSVVFLFHWKPDFSFFSCILSDHYKNFKYCFKFTIFFYCRQTLNLFARVFETSIKEEVLGDFSGLFRDECKSNIILLTMYVYYVYPAMSKSLKQQTNFTTKSRNRHRSNRFQRCSLIMSALLYF